MLGPTCGLLMCLVTTALAAMEGFIVGGNFANILHHPHSAFLNVNCVLNTSVKTGWMCGASVVNQRILLSAGHCLYRCTGQSRVSFNLGNEHRARGQVYLTNGFLIHEDYNPVTSSNDLSLLRVNRPLTFSRTVSRIALMRRPPYTERATVAGWGMVDEIRERQSERLKYIKQTIWSRQRCLEVLKYLSRGTICAANENPEDYPTSGDSGSALVVRGYIQIGLVSYKIPNLARHVIVYTDVGYFYDWIKFYAKVLYCI